MNEYLIKDARCVDGKTIDILVINGIIKRIASKIDEDVPIIKIDKDCYLSAGWIDSHSHCFKKFSMYSDDCEVIGYQSGVTSVVDAGTAGADNVEEFYNDVKGCKTHVYSLINISKTGIYAQNELENLNDLDINLLQNACAKYPDFIVGVKARMSKSVVGKSGDKPLDIALKAAELVNLPLMVHIGSAPSLLETVIAKVRKNDIITHIFNPKDNGIIDHEGKLKSCVFKAREKGVYFDLGHGSDSFSFDVLEKANKAGIKVDTISSDIYNRNRINGPVYDLASTMSKLWNNGYSLEEVIEAVTTNANKIFNFKNIGLIKEGYLADFTIFKIVNENKQLIDSKKEVLEVKQYIKPVAVILEDEMIYI